MAKSKHPYPDYQKVRIKNRYQDITVPYGEVRLGIHDPSIEDSICKEAQLRMGTSREASVYEIKKERSQAKRAAKAPTIESEKPKKKD